MYTKKQWMNWAGLLALSFTILLSSCSKTEYEYEKRSYNGIESFSLVGYTGDSMQAVINNDNIIVYWAAEAQQPATIRPVIVVSSHATIFPASGTEVPFTGETVYTVTAEDGTVKKYHLKPVVNYALPRIYNITPGGLSWISNTIVTVSGEYFLSGAVSDVRVFAQRVRDGFEFDLHIDQAALTMTNIRAVIPSYSNTMDTGMHVIKVKVGNRISDEKTLRITQPTITGSGDLINITFPEAGQTLVAGDSMTVKFSDNHNGNVCKWYKKKFTRVSIENYTFEAAELAQTDSTVKFKLPAAPLNMKPFTIAMWFPDGSGNISYFSKFVGPWPELPVKK
jgi:hypothetical protein